MTSCLRPDRSRDVDARVCVAIDGAAGYVFMGGGGMDVRRPTQLVGRLVQRRPTREQLLQIDSSLHW